MAIRCNQGFAVYISSMVDHDSRPPALLDIGFDHFPVGNSDDFLTMWTYNINALMNILTAFPFDTRPATKVGNNSAARRDTFWKIQLAVSSAGYVDTTDACG